MMKNTIFIRLLALVSLSTAILLPSALRAQTNDDNATNESGNRHSQLIEFGKDVELGATDSARDIQVFGHSAKT
jgi:hypothetical protein